MSNLHFHKIPLKNSWKYLIPKVTFKKHLPKCRKCFKFQTFKKPSKSKKQKTNNSSWTTHVQPILKKKNWRVKNEINLELLVEIVHVVLDENLLQGLLELGQRRLVKVHVDPVLLLGQPGLRLLQELSHGVLGEELLALLRVKRIRVLEEPGQIRSRKIRYYERQTWTQHEEWKHIKNKERAKKVISFGVQSSSFRKRTHL